MSTSSCSCSRTGRSTTCSAISPSRRADVLDVDGLKAGMANEYAGHSYPVFKLEKTALNKAQDPCHSGECVDRQVAGGNGGFAADYIETRADPASSEPVVVMGYYDGEQAAGLRLPRQALLRLRPLVLLRQGSDLPEPEFMPWPAGPLGAATTRARPPTTSRHSSAGSTLRGQPGGGTRTNSSRPSGRSTATTSRRRSTTCDRSRLPSRRRTSSRPPSRVGPPDVAWIDPNFVDVGGAAGSNDDHPPSDVRAGQELVLRASSTRSSRASALGEDAPRPHVRRARRLLRSRGASEPPKTTTRGPSSTPTGRGCPRSSSPPRVRPGASPRALRPHVDHQDMPRPLLPTRGRC